MFCVKLEKAATDIHKVFKFVLKDVLTHTRTFAQSEKGRISTKNVCSSPLHTMETTVCVMRFEVFMVVKVHILNFWVYTLCNTGTINRCSAGT